MNVQALHIKEDGTINQIVPKNGTDFSLEELQGYVDGKIEIVDLRNGDILVVNEEGKFTKQLNPCSTFIAHLQQAILGRDYIAGDVVVCPSEMVK